MIFLFVTTEEPDYSIAFYICDAFIILGSLTALKLDVKLEKSGEKVTKSLKKIFTYPSMILFSLAALQGLCWGVHDTYLFVYLQEELGASSSLISISLSTGMVVGLVLSLLSKRLISWTGEINMVALGTFLEAARLGIYAVVK